MYRAVLPSCLLTVTCVLTGVLAHAAEAPAAKAEKPRAIFSVPANAPTSVPATPTEQFITRTALRYDTDYPMIGYAEPALDNPVARLQERLNKHEIKLEYRGTRGYLDSLLAALEIDPSSQTLVFSKTSLQIDQIRAATPRAIYFNDNTYVAYVQNSHLLEFATMDRTRGQVFYTMQNIEEHGVNFDREIGRCLTCHDTFGLAGGGVPRFLFMSSHVGTNGEALNNQVSNETTDETPIDARWGGWYVTGQHGEQTHLGNLLVTRGEDLINPTMAGRANLPNLRNLLDTRPYLTDKSDIVALLVFEHQAYVENLVTRANFKSRTFLARLNRDQPLPDTWDALSARSQTLLRPMIESLVRGLLFVNAAPLNGRISSSSGFDKWFERRGPRDAQGRSLRKLDLQTRTFRYPLSYLIYSDGFDGLLPCVKDRIYHRLEDILSGTDTSPDYQHLTNADREAVMQILKSTVPAFAQVAGA